MCDCTYISTLVAGVNVDRWKFWWTNNKASFKLATTRSTTRLYVSIKCIQWTTMIWCDIDFVIIYNEHANTESEWVDISIPFINFLNFFLFSDLQFPIDLSNVAKDHPFLENDPLQSLYRRLVALNRCAKMRLDSSAHKHGTNNVSNLLSI